jgi:hypothetical protein
LCHNYRSINLSIALRFFNRSLVLAGILINFPDQLITLTRTYVCTQGMREDPAFGFVDNTGGGWDGCSSVTTLGGSGGGAAAADMYAFRVVPSQPNLHGMAYGSHDLRLG